MVIFLLFFLLISNAVTLERDKSILFSRVVILGIILSSLMAFNNLFIMGLENGIGLYGGLFNITIFTQSFNIFILLVSGVILILTSFYPRKLYSLSSANKNTGMSLYQSITQKFVCNTKIRNNIINKAGEQFAIIEYPLVITFILSGALLLISSADLISIFLSIELQSYGLYILSTLYRDSESATASGLTYFLLGGLSSCFILLGSALLYANSGTTNLDNIYVISSISQVTDASLYSQPALQLSSLSTGIEKGSEIFIPLTTEKIGWYQSSYLHLSFIIMSVGFLFKVSAAPFHFWSPDVYDGIPTIVTTFVAIIAKISIFAFLLELVYYTEFYFPQDLGSGGSNSKEITSSLQIQGGWKNILLLSSLLSLIVGSVLGLTQSRIKRLLAYSTISHVGFILLALCINSIESVQAYIFYILQYSVSNLNAFIILVTIGYSLYLYVYKNEKDQTESEQTDKKLIDENNSPIQLVNQLKGYFYINSAIAISLAITLFSFVGVPPLIGFFAKQMVLSSALDAGYIFMSLIAILTSVIGAAYYLSVIKQIFFYKSDYEIHSDGAEVNITGYVLPIDLANDDKVKLHQTKADIILSSSLASTIAIITLILISFIFTPGEWLNLSSILSLVLFKS